MKIIVKNSGDLDEISLIYNKTQECPKTCKILEDHEKILNDTKSKIKQVKRAGTQHMKLHEAIIDGGNNAIASSSYYFKTCKKVSCPSATESENPITTMETTNEIPNNDTTPTFTGKMI